MTVAERKATAGLASLFGVRMFGLFLILPVFALYAPQLEGYTPGLMGLAIGIYGLTQALLQIPMGLASDRFGRRPVILFGLALFVAGSVVAALSTSIYGVIAGRALQGSGAISAAVMALAADVTRDSQRTKAMAFIGISVGGAYLLALVLGPLFASWGGLAGVFWGTAALAALSVWVLFALVPSEPPKTAAVDTRLAPVLRDPDLVRLSFGIFALHLILTAGWVALPALVGSNLGLARESHWWFYAVVLLASLVLFVPVLAFGERRRIMHRVLPWVVLAMVLAELALALGLQTPLLLVLALWVYFAMFNTLEASLPSLVSRYAPGGAKGGALGVYSTAQFLGAFCGGSMGGVLYGRYGIAAVFYFGAGVALLWFLASLGLRAPQPVAHEREGL